MQSSFVESANNPDGPFPLNNLPYAVCTPADTDAPTVSVVIGDHVLNLSAVASQTPTIFAGPLLPPSAALAAFSSPTLNAFLRLGRPVWAEVRAHLQDALSSAPANAVLKLAIEAPTSTAATPKHHLLPSRTSVTFHIPLDVGDYTDFYSSRKHAENVGHMFRGPAHALPPNWLHMPIGYHGRASTILPSGTPIRRPRGQLAPAATSDNTAPSDDASHRLDFELEVATVLGGTATPLGTRLTMQEASERVFGFTLMNDWSARDIQKWEYVPLGPFNAKNFATTISPFIVPFEALLPFRIPLPVQSPTPLPYLLPTAGVDVPSHACFDVNLQVAIRPQDEQQASIVCRSNMRNLYWSVAQQAVHQSETGCILRPGDILGSGTISGSEDGSFGSLLELSWNGTRSVKLDNSPSVATRTFLLDGDTVYLSGTARGDGFCIGFGDCIGKIIASDALPLSSN